MAKIMLIGAVGAGKTTLKQALQNEKVSYDKTQSIEYDSHFIDTPGEYTQSRAFHSMLQVTASQAGVIIFLMSATQQEVIYSPNYSQNFTQEVVGVITKIDIADEEDIKLSEQQLKDARVSRVFKVSSLNGEGLFELKEYLREVIAR